MAMILRDANGTATVDDAEDGYKEVPAILLGKQCDCCTELVPALGEANRKKIMEGLKATYKQLEVACMVIGCSISELSK